MAHVTVPLTTFASGQFPAVCAVSGVPAEGLFVVRLGRHHIPGKLPINGTVARSLQRQRFVGSSLMLAALVLTTVAALQTSALLGASAAVSAITSAFVVTRLLAATPTAIVANSNVTLRRVHDAFASAVSGGANGCATCTSAGSCAAETLAACTGASAP